MSGILNNAPGACKVEIFDGTIAERDGKTGKMTIDPKSLKLFVSVIQNGTIAAAAEREHIAAAAVSRRVSELEALLGTELVIRSNKGLLPTAAGRALLDLSQRVLNDLDEIHGLMRSYARGLTGYVRVYANISAITQFMPKELSAFLRENPSVQINLEEKVSSVISHSVLENLADVGIQVMDTPVPGLEFYPYKEDELVVAVPSGHPLETQSQITFAETLGYDYVGLHSQSQLNLQLVRAASEIGKAWRPRIQVTSYDALCLMIEAGLGIGILPRRVVSPYGKALGIVAVSLSEAWARRTLAVCIRSYEALSPAAQLFVDHLLRRR